MSYFKFWPTFAMAGFSRIGRRASSVALGSSCGSPSGDADRHVIGLAFVPGEGIADDFRPARIDAGGFGIERDLLLFRHFGDEPVQSLDGVDCFVAMCEGGSVDIGIGSVERI